MNEEPPLYRKLGSYEKHHFSNMIETEIDVFTSATPAKLVIVDKSESSVTKPDTMVVSESNQRSKRIFQAGFSAILCKGIVLGVNAISIPIAVRYLGTEQFGIWITISTTLALLIVLDLGIASAMTNLISEAYALNDKVLAADYATTGLVIMTLIAIALGIIGTTLWPFINWADLFHLSGKANNQMVSRSVATAYAIFLVGLPSSLAAKFLGGYQEVQTVNIFAAIGASANLFAVVLITYIHGGLVLLVAGSSGATVGTNFACLIWLWFWHKPWLKPNINRWNKKLIRPMLQSGGGLFILQLAGLIVFNSDNFVIAHYLGPSAVTPYSVTWKLVGYTAALQIIITPALWPAYSEAWVRQDIYWIRRTLKQVMLVTMGAATIGTTILAIWGKEIIHLWAGPDAVPDQPLIILMCLWILISTFMANTATVLAATNNVRLQAWLSVIAAIVNLLLSIWLVQRIGAVGVILGTIGSYVLILVGPQTLKTLQVLKVRPSTSSKYATEVIKNEA